MSVSKLSLVALLALSILPATAQGKTLRFAGYDWYVRTGTASPPGPNDWNDANAWVDKSGALHLRLSRQASGWACAEVWTARAFGYGSYQFQVSGPIDRLDPNVVLGLFSYPAPGAPAMTNEIDFEMARWGTTWLPNLNYTVWPALSGLAPVSQSFDVTLGGDRSTHVYDRTASRIQFDSFDGYRTASRYRIASWTFAPANPAETLSQLPMPVHMNLWLFQGKAPMDGLDVEVVIQSFLFTPH